MDWLLGYCKVPIISPGLIFVQKAVLLGLSEGCLRLRFGGLIVGRAYFWRGFLSELNGKLIKQSFQSLILLLGPLKRSTKQA